jgi:hypothetical protein
MNMRSHLLNWLYDGAIFVLIAAFFLLAPLQIVVYDDAYVYFTYARNFVEGRPFAYDPRNIPSEGFTSLLYMLMLVPAELLRVNPILARRIDQHDRVSARHCCAWTSRKGDGRVLRSRRYAVHAHFERADLAGLQHALASAFRL